MVEFFFDNIDKIFYLDFDLVVIFLLEELYNIDIENYFFVVLGFFNILVKSKGFNSGVMVVNLEKWRNEKILIKLIDFVIKNRGKLLYWD